MAHVFPGTMSSLTASAPAVFSRRAHYNEIYSDHCHRIYSLAFWMSGNELTAEQLSANTFLRVFASGRFPDTDQIDRAFLTEITEHTPIGSLTLNCISSDSAVSVRSCMNRRNLEEAVLSLPPTEKLIFLFHDMEGYGHEKISPLLGITEQQSKHGLHQARLQIRSLMTQV